MDKKYKNAISFCNIYDAFTIARRGSFWKDSIIDYDINRLYYSVKICRSLNKKKYKLKGYYKFTIQEREKIRNIQSLHITDRVVQHSLCDNILTEELRKHFVYDNGASLKGKGTNFCRDRLKVGMQKYYRKNGIDGYVLQCDVRKYFDNIPHEYLEKRMSKYFSGSEELVKHLINIINSFDGDHGIGLGSQVCQLFALDALDSMDHFIKEVLQIKYYGRYADDFWLIHENKEYLKICEKEIKMFLCSTTGLELHDKKTQIFPLKNGIRYLGFHFYLTDTGGIHVKLLQKSANRIKRKIRKMINKGVIEEDVRKTFTSWKGHALYGDSYYLVKNIENYMDNLISQRNLLNSKHT